MTELSFAQFFLASEYCLNFWPLRSSGAPHHDVSTSWRQVMPESFADGGTRNQAAEQLRAKPIAQPVKAGRQLLQFANNPDDAGRIGSWSDRRASVWTEHLTDKVVRTRKVHHGLCVFINGAQAAGRDHLP